MNAAKRAMTEAIRFRAAVLIADAKHPRASLSLSPRATKRTTRMRLVTHSQPSPTLLKLRAKSLKSKRRFLSD